MEQKRLQQIYENVHREIAKKKYRSAMEAAAGMVVIASSNDDQKYILLGKYFLGLCYYHLYDYQSAMDKYLELANLILQPEFDLESLHLEGNFFDHVRYGMAYSMYNLGDLDGSSIILGHILENTVDVEIFLDSAILLGLINLKMYELKEDLGYIISTLEMYLALLEETNLPRPKKVGIYNRLAILFTYQGEYQQAQEMLNNSIILANSPEKMVFIYSEMARINLQLNKFEKVQKNLEKAKEYLASCPNLTEKSYYFHMWGLLYREREQFAESQRLLEKSLSLARQTNNLVDQIGIYYELAGLYEKIGYEKNSQYHLDYHNLRESLNFVKEFVKWQLFWPASRERLFASKSKRG